MLHFWRIGSHSAICIPDGLTEDAVASLKAEHIDAFRKGFPFSLGLPDLECAQHHDPAGKVSYSAGRFAWIDGQDERTFWLLNLRTGERKSYSTEERATLDRVAVSASMVAVTNHYGKCSIWEIADNRQWSFTLPSAQIDELLISGHTLAVVYLADIQDCGARVPIVSWNMKYQRTHSFSLKIKTPEPRRSHKTSVMFDKDGESIVHFQVFYTGLGKNYDHCCHSIRASLSGEIIAQEFCYMEVPWEIDKVSNPVQANHVATIWSYSSRRGDYHNRVYYHFNENRLKVDTHLKIDLHQDTKSIRFWWEDLAFFSEDYSPDASLRVFDVRTGSCDYTSIATTDTWLKRPWDEEDEHPISEDRLSTMILGDNIFQIHVYCEGIGVWCFDKTIDMLARCYEYEDFRLDSMKPKLRFKDYLSPQHSIENCSQTPQISRGALVSPDSLSITSSTPSSSYFQLQYD